MPRQSLGTPNITGATVEELRISMQFWIQQVYNHLDKLTGLGGTPTFYSDLDANGMRVKNIADATDATDAVTRQQTIVQMMNTDGNMVYDAQGIRVINGNPGIDGTDFVTLQQVLEEINNAMTLGGSAASFVTANLEATLLNERQAAVEPSVLVLTDNGAGATLVWSVATNGIGNSKLRQGAATSIIGRAANSVGDVADIATSTDGQVLRRAGGALGFGAVDLADSDAITGTLPVGNGGTGVTAPTGTYTPTLTNVANLDASTAYQCLWMRMNNMVLVSGKVDVDPTLAATSTQLGISLPIASNLGAAEDCVGTAFASGVAGQGAAILADTVNERAQLQFVSGDVTNQAMYFTFLYRIL